MGTLQAPIEQPAPSSVIGNIVYLLLGLYGWEYTQSLCIEYAVISGRLPFRLPLVPYIVGRLFLLVYLIVLAIWAGVTSPLSAGNLCQVGVLLPCILGDIVMGCSSTIFVIRTWMIWKDSRWVHVLLLLLTLGLWIIFAFGVSSVRSTNVNGVCENNIDHPQWNAAGFLCITCYDFLLFVLLVVGLSRQRSGSPLKKRLQTQGILYFAAAGIAYIPSMVVGLLNNTYLFIIFSDCALTASMIISSRAVRSLLSLDTTTPGQTMENNMALTTQIVIHSSTTRMNEGVSDERPCVDKSESC